MENDAAIAAADAASLAKYFLADTGGRVVGGRVAGEAILATVVDATKDDRLALKSLFVPWPLARYGTNRSWFYAESMVPTNDGIDDHEERASIFR